MIYGTFASELIAIVVGLGVLWLLISSAVASGVSAALRRHAKRQSRRLPRRPNIRESQTPSSFDITE